MTKAKEQAALIKRGVEQLKVMGAVKGAEPYDYKLAVPTRAGTLMVHFDPDMNHAGQVPTITAFCRFEAVFAARKALGWDDAKAGRALLTADGDRLNPYSGKWNWHGLTRDGLEAFFDAVERIKP